MIHGIVITIYTITWNNMVDYWYTLYMKQNVWLRNNRKITKLHCVYCVTWNNHSILLIKLINLPHIHCAPMSLHCFTWSPPSPHSHTLDKMAAILTDDTLKCIILKENYIIPIQISLKFVSRCPIYNKPASFQVMAWRRTGGKPLQELLLITDAYMRN